MRFNDARTYTIQIQGRVQEEDISRIIPQRFVIEHVAGTNTLITVQTDQSGMVGVVRHLHSLGMILIMVGCRNENLPNTGSGTKGDMEKKKGVRMDVNTKFQNRGAWFTAPIAILMAIVAGGGIFIHDLYRDVPGLVAQAKGQDLISLFFVLPILIITAILARRGSLPAQLIWIGGLVYLVYTYASFSFAIRYNPLFLAYIALLGCSLYALIYSLTSLDMTGVKMRFTENTPVKPICIYLGVMAMLFYCFWLSDLVPALIAGKIPQSIIDDQTPTNAIHVLDMAWILPAFLISAVSLWRRRPLGYTLAGVMLPFFALLVTATLSMALLQARGGDPEAVFLIAMFGVLLASAIGMLAWYMKSLRNQSGTRKEELTNG